MRVLSLLLCTAVPLASAACAVRYYDAETGAEHIWGIGHLVVKTTAPTDGRVAIIRGADLIGLGVSTGTEQGAVALGWSSTWRVEIVETDTSVALINPHTPLTLRVGAAPDSVQQQGPSK